MKAPDKIYACKTDVRGQEEQIWLSYPLSTTTNVEYIRKDALLEFAKEKKKQLLEQELTKDEPSDVAAGINAGLDMLIGKLNSM